MPKQRCPGCASSGSTNLPFALMDMPSATDLERSARFLRSQGRKFAEALGVPRLFWPRTEEVGRLGMTTSEHYCTAKLSSPPRGFGDAAAV